METKHDGHLIKNKGYVVASGMSLGLMVVIHNT